MLTEEFKQAIRIVAERLKRNNIVWAIVGSTNLVLQGIPKEPHDLDIVVSLEDLKRIRDLFEEYAPSEITPLKTVTDEPAWDVKMKINAVDVQVLGERKEGTYVKPLLNNKVLWVQMNEIKVPCLALTAEANAYEKTNRQQKAKEIRDFLNTRN
jgi:hypothetical protein